MFPSQDTPYPGPISFEEEQQRLFFGREIAVRKLVSFIRSQSIIVLYGKSGTGKTSLLKAGIIPALRKVSKPKAEIIGVIRFQGKLPATSYVESVLHQLNINTDDSTATLLEWYKSKKTQWEDLQHKILIFDQFEEFFTVSPEAWREREGFFDQLDDLLTQHKDVRVLLIIREDFLADLFRYSARLSGGIDIRFQLLMLTPDEAREAIRKPVEYYTEAKTTYTREAADAIISALRTEQNRSSTGSGEKTYPAEFVSPLLLQLVCSYLWTQLPPQIELITKEDVERIVDVDATVTNFYKSLIERIASEHNQLPRDLYSWFETELISGEKRIPAFVRGDLVGSFSISIARTFEKYHLIRRDINPEGVKFYELAHDRFVWAVRKVAEEHSLSTQTDISKAADTDPIVNEEILAPEDVYRTPDEQVSAKRIWNELSRLVSRGRLSAAEALVVIGEALSMISDLLDNVLHVGPNLISLEQLAELRPSINLISDEWQQVQNVIMSGITQYSPASIQDIFYWLLNEAARSRPQSFNDIFTPFTVGQLMMSLLAPSRGDVYDPFCHSGELFGYFKRELLPESDIVSNHLLAVDRFVDSKEVAQTLLKVAGLNSKTQVLIDDALTSKIDVEGQFDYVFTNPPFNEKMVDWAAIPPSRKLLGESSNSNIAWIQHIYSALKPSGRAAFLMVSGLAKSNEQVLRELVMRGSLEAIVDLGQDRLYRGVATHIWFLNRALEGLDAPVLFIDMTEIGIQRRPRLFTDAHIERVSRIMATFREAVQENAVDDSLLSDQPGFCKVKQRSELLVAERLDLAPKSHVVPLPRVEPTRNVRALIQEYQSLRAEATQLDAKVSDVLSRIANRL